MTVTVMVIAPKISKAAHRFASASEPCHDLRSDPFSGSGRAVAVIQACFAWLLLSLCGGVLMAFSGKVEPMALSAKIDGDYQVMPAEASDESLRVPLGTLLVDPAKIKAIDSSKVRGKITFIRLVGGVNEVRVMMIDTSGSAFFDEALKAEVLNEPEAEPITYVLKRNWTSSDEWGSSRGTTIATLSKDKDGYLVVGLNMTAQGRTFIFPRGPTKGTAWLKYSPVASPNPPVPPSTPPKKKDEGSTKVRLP